MRSCAGIPATDRVVAAAALRIQSVAPLATHRAMASAPIRAMNVVAAADCSVAVACGPQVAIPPAIPAATVDVVYSADTSAMSTPPVAVDVADAGRPADTLAAAATAVVACDVPADTDRPTVPAVQLPSSRATAAARCRPAVEPHTATP